MVQVGSNVAQMWIVMSLAMMSPIALYLAWQKSRSFFSSTNMFLGFYSVWILAAIPVQLLHNVTKQVQVSYLAFILWTLASVYQYSLWHRKSLISCMEIPRGKSFSNGVQLGGKCLVACGLLMLAMTLTLPMTLGPMLAAAAVMFFQVVSERKVIISRVIGLVGGIYGLGILFLSTPVMNMGTLVIHHHG